MSKLALLAGPAMLVISGATLYATTNEEAPTPAPAVDAKVAKVAKVREVAEVAEVAKQSPAAVTAAPLAATTPKVAGERRLSVEHGSATRLTLTPDDPAFATLAPVLAAIAAQPPAPETPAAAQPASAPAPKAPASAAAAASATVTAGTSATAAEKPAAPAPAAAPAAAAKATAKEPAVQAAKGKAASKSVERARRGEPSGRWLGMKLEAVTGIRVSDVASESVAERYGLKPGDVLLSVDGRPLTRVDELMAAVRENRRPVLSFTVLRGGKTFRMLVDAQPVMTQAAEVPAAAESRAIRVGSKSFSNELGGIVLVRSSANGPVSFSAVFRDADGATRSLQFTGEPLELLERVAVLPESLRRVVVEWLR